MPAPRAGSGGRSRTRTTSARCCGWRPAPGWSSRRAASPSASRTPTASRCTARRVLVYWDFRRMNELGISVGTAYQDQAVSTVYVGPGHGEYAAFQPGAANAMGYDDLKVIEAYNFLRSIAEGVPHGTTLDDAVRSAVALDAMAQSAGSGAWVELPR